jgi:hypothetical protein
MDRVKEVNYGDCFYFRPLTMASLDQVDPCLAINLHNNSYRNPAEFTIVLTGNVDRDTLLPLVCKYLASIPPTDLPIPKAISDIKALPVCYPEQPVVEDFKVWFVACGQVRMNMLETGIIKSSYLETPFLDPFSSSSSCCCCCCIRSP